MKLKDLCNAILKDPQGFDFKRAMKDHEASKDYSPYLDFEELHEQLGLALSEKDNSRLTEVCLKILDTHTFDIESHALISQAAFRAGNKPLHHLHNFIASSLLDILLKSGDGSNYHTAYKISHPKDEMAVFTYLRKYPKDRVSHEKFDRVYDIYTLEDGGKLFFDISSPILHASGENQATARKSGTEKTHIGKGPKKNENSRREKGEEEQ